MGIRLVYHLRHSDVDSRLYPLQLHGSHSELDTDSKPMHSSIVLCVTLHADGGGVRLGTHTIPVTGRSTPGTATDPSVHGGYDSYCSARLSSDMQYSYYSPSEDS